MMVLIKKLPCVFTVFRGKKKHFEGNTQERSGV